MNIAESGFATTAVKEILTDLINLSPLVKERKVERAAGFLSVFLAGISMIFFLAAFYMWMESHYSLIAAVGFTGLIIFMLAAASFGIYAFLLWRKRQEFLAFRRELVSAVPETIESIEHEINGFVQDSPKTAVLLASLLGFSAAR